MSTWSTPQLDLEVVGALAWPSATVWRCSRGFAADDHAGVFTLARRRAAPPAAGLLTDWLARSHPDLRLRVLLALGESAEDSVAWLGLTALGATPAAAMARLAGPAEALAEALDVWSLFSLQPEAPPVLPEPCHHLHLPSRAGEHLLSEFTPPLEIISQLGRRRRPLVLDFCLAPRGVDLSAVAEIESAQAKIQRAIMNDSPGNPLPEPELVLARLDERASNLLDDALALNLRARLWGQPPGEVLLPRLLASLSDALNTPVGLRAEEAAPVSVGRRMVSNLLALLRAGDARGVHAPGEEVDDEPSFSGTMIRF